MAKSRQSFPNITSRFLSALDDNIVSKEEVEPQQHDDKKSIAG